MTSSNAASPAAAEVATIATARRPPRAGAAAGVCFTGGVFPLDADTGRAAVAGLSAISFTAAD